MDELCSTLKANRVCRSRFSTRRSQTSDPSSIKNLNDRKIVQISPWPRPSLAVDSNGCAMRLGLMPSPPHPPSPRRKQAFTRVADTSSSGGVRAPTVSASGTSRTRRSQSSSPPSRATGASAYATPTCSAVIDRREMYCLQENGRSPAMGVRGNLGAVSDSYRISCKGSNGVKETPGLIELGTFGSCTRLLMTFYPVFSSPQRPTSYLTYSGRIAITARYTVFLSHIQNITRVLLIFWLNTQCQQ